MTTATKEYQRAYYAKNRERTLNRSREWYLKNVDRLRMVHREKSRVRRAENPDRLKKYSHDYHVRMNAENPKLRWLRAAICNAKMRCKKNGWEFSLNITVDDLPSVCPVLGCQLEYSTIGRGRGLKAQGNCPSLDRFDSSRGYTDDNVAVISLRANVLKKDGTLSEIEAIASWMRRVSSKEAGG